MNLTDVTRALISNEKTDDFAWQLINEKNYYSLSLLKLPINTLS
jgi:hypothetical protein